MLESKFLFVAKIFLLAFIIINVPNFLPFNLNDSSYWILIFTTIFDTTTLLVLSSSISKYINLKNLNHLEDLYIKDGNNQTTIERIEIFKNKTIYDTRQAFIIFIFFLISTLIQPIVLIFDINKSDLYSTAVVE